MIYDLQFTIYKKWVPVLVTCYVLLVAFIQPVYAQSPSPTSNTACIGINTDLGCIPTDDPVRFAAKIYEIGLYLIGSVALIFIIYGGYLVLTSRGDQLQLGKGKSYIVSAVIGLILAIAGFALYQIIAVDVIKIPGFRR